MGKVWPLTGLAIRVATVHGLHRDPSALPLGTLDVIQVELRLQFMSRTLIRVDRSAWMMLT